MAAHLTVDPERKLIDASLDGDSRACVELFRLHDHLVRAAMWRVLGSRRALDDVMQEVHLRAFRSLASFDPDGSAAFSTWLFRIALSCAIDHRRRQQRQPEVVPLDAVSALPAADGPLDEQVVWRDALRRGFQRLEPETAASIALVDGEGLTQQQAADVLGADRNRVARRLSEGRRSMASYLRHEGVNLT